MSKETERLLTEQQTGVYVPTEQEAALLESIRSNRIPRPQDGLPRPGPAFFENRINPLGEMRNEIVTPEAIQAGWGQSRFDRGEFTPGEDLENKRALEQSGFSKILNGTMKGGVFALTTAAETTAGIVNGLFSGLGELGRQIATGDEISVNSAVGRGVDNWTARTMADIQKLSEEWFPNYRTEEERSSEYQSQWLRHIFTPNFIGDSFLKNLGFTVGALVGGAAWSKVLNAGLKTLTAGKMLKGVTAAASGDKEAKSLLEGVAKAVGGVGDVSIVADDAAIAKTFGQAAKGLNKLTTKHELFGGIIAAMGEGTMEGVMARNEFMDDWNGRLREEYANSYENLEQSIIDEELAKSGSTLLRAIPQFDEEGNAIEPRYELNDAGLKLLGERQRELAADYAKKRQWAENLGDRLAATTFFWNLPVLTVSNTMQFGRMLSGGFKTARSNVAKVAGDITMNAGKLTAEYTDRTANRGLRVAARSLRNGAAEAAEEMAQGFISSGAKNVADSRLTSFNDDGYDRRVLSDVGAWFSQMMEGGGEYLGDWKNWQEGFMGLATGLLGIPGKRWNGGVVGAAQEIREEDRMSQAAAEKLNARVNDPKFQEAWRGYVRHNKYDAQMEEAARNDDHYAWTTANDKQKISDIMMFANAGRLQDLYDIVDNYANMTDAQAEEKGVTEQATTQQNQTQVQNNPAETIEKVREQAKDIKDTIQMYSDMYDAMTTLAPIGTSDSQLQEMIATSMNIKAMEKRFLTMFDEVVKGLEPYVTPLSSIGKEGEEITDEKKTLDRAKEIYSNLARIITNTGNGINYETVQDYFDSIATMRTLEDMVESSGDPTFKQKFADMKKIANDRRAFLKKLVTLQNMEPGEYDTKVKTPEKVTTEVQKQNAQKAVNGLGNFKDIRRRYMELAENGEQAQNNFIDSIAPLEKENPAVKEFLAFKKRYDAFRAYVSKGIDIQQPEGAMQVTGPMIESVLDDIFYRTTSADDLAQLPPAAFRVESSFLDDESLWMNIPGLPTVKPSPATYDALKDGLRNAMRKFMAMETSTASRNTGSSKPVADNPPAGTTDSTPTGYDASQPGSNVNAGPAAQAAPQPFTPEVVPPAAEPAPTETPAETQPEAPVADTPVSLDVSAGQVIDNSMDAEEETVPQAVTDDVGKENGHGREKYLYYRTSVPEIATVEARKARRAIEMRSRDLRKDADLSDFIEYLQHNVARAQENVDNAANANEKRDAETELKLAQQALEGWKDIWFALKDRGAFDEAAMGIQTGDEVEFIIDPSFPTYKGKQQILLRNKRTGKIYSVLSNQVSDYFGLRDLHKAIDGEYAASNVGPNDIFVFSKTSRVFAKPSGLIDYAFDAAPRDIREIPGYDSVKDAPILYISRNGTPTIIRGDKATPIPEQYNDAMKNVRAYRQESMFLLVPMNKNFYIPIGITTAKFSASNKDADNPVIKDIRKQAMKIVNFVKNAGDDLIAENEGLAARVKGLAAVLDIHDIDFRIEDREGVTSLSIVTGKPSESAVGDSPVYFAKDAITEEMLVDFLAAQNKHIRPEVENSKLKHMSYYVSEGLLESNAAMLRPKGVDVYIYPWLGDKFGIASTQQAEIAEQEQKEDVKETPVVAPLDDDYSAVDPEDDTEVYEASENSQPITPQEDIPAQDAEEDKPITWVSLGEDVRGELKKQGYTSDFFDTLSEEMKHQLVSCINVG
ncbi:MAG: hypothetical protein II661_06810 [Bacteroidales bacterium]|nr:hypothetical protein [Bacteroidales bacterium]